MADGLLPSVYGCWLKCTDGPLALLFLCGVVSVQVGAITARNFAVAKQQQ